MAGFTVCLTAHLALAALREGVRVAFRAPLPAFLHHIARRVGLYEPVSRRAAPVSMWRRRSACYLERTFGHSVDGLDASLKVNGPLNYVATHCNTRVSGFVAVLPGAALDKYLTPYTLERVRTCPPRVRHP